MLVGEHKSLSLVHDGKLGIRAGRSFVKDLVRVGRYSHPVDGWTLDVTADRIDGWVGKFEQMSANGVRVPLSKDHKNDADSLLGYVTSMWRDGDTCLAMIEPTDDDAAALCAKVNQVSIDLDEEFKDGEGRAYGESIWAASITPTPIVPRQSPFIEVTNPVRKAASRVPVMSLSTKGASMDYKELAKLFGLDDLTEANAIERLKGWVGDQSAKGKRVDDELAAMKAKIGELEKGDTPELDKDDAEDRAETYEQSIDSLVDAGAITPAVAASLKPALLGAKGARPGYMLSTRISKTADPVAKAVILALKQNKAAELKEQTAAQTVEMSRTVPGDTKPVDPAVTKGMASTAYGK